MRLSLAQQERPGGSIQLLLERISRARKLCRPAVGGPGPAAAFFDPRVPLNVTWAGPGRIDDHRTVTDSAPAVIGRAAARPNLAGAEN